MTPDALSGGRQWDTQEAECAAWATRWNERIDKELGCNIADCLETVVKQMYVNGWTADDSVITLGRVFRLLDGLAKTKLRRVRLEPEQREMGMVRG